MIDPVQLLIDAGAIPATPFVPQSRYYGTPIAVFQPGPGDPPLAYVQRRFIPRPAAIGVATLHLVKALDRCDLLASTYFGEPLFDWRIADANLVFDPGALTRAIGRRIAIPPPPTL